MVFLVSTTLVAIFKSENVRIRGKRQVQEETHGVMETYKQLLSIIKMPTVFTFCCLLLTAKVWQADLTVYVRLSVFCVCNPNWVL